MNPSGLEYFDVLIVGAGLSGIGAARKLQEHCPTQTFIILEGRSALGGTWDLFKYPGIRSDSDMFTMSYDNKPWRSDTQVASSADVILSYLKEAATERGIDRAIRYEEKVTGASWDSKNSRWNVSTSKSKYLCRILYVCSGYYKYDEGYTPPIPGLSSFEGTLIHPQHWPKHFDYSNKKVVVIGSGATAMTIVPEMAKTAKHVIMLQRTPTYVIAWPKNDFVAHFLKSLLPAHLAHKVIRWKNIYSQHLLYKFARKYPNRMKAFLNLQIAKYIGTRHDIEKHFSPPYKPWDQRLCLLPDGDLLKAIDSGRASVITDEIDQIFAKAIKLKSGTTIEADVIVTATGLNLQSYGGIQIDLDGTPIPFKDHFSYRGLMVSDVPNLFYSFGYVNASWTLRSELVSQYVCRIINHMKSHNKKTCTPKLRPEDANMQTQPLVSDFTPSYVQRDIDQFTKQGDRAPWLAPQNYFTDRKSLIKNQIEDGVLQFD